MSASANDITNTLNANYKAVYADDIVEMIPDGVKLLKDIKFVEGDKQQGGTYHQPICTALEHGASFGVGEDIINLEAAVAGKLEDLTVTGFQMVMRAQWGWTAISRATGKKAAFRNATEVILTNLMKSHKKKLEALMLYGQSGIGVVGSISGNDVRLTDATCAEGLWVGAKNMPIDFWTGATYSTQTLSKSTTITAVTIAPSSPYVTLTVADSSGILANDTIHFKGSHGKEFMGIHKILTQTSGTLFGLSQSSYPDLLQGTAGPSTAGQLTYQKIVKAAALAMPKGGEGKFKVYCHQESWQDVVNDMESARDFGDYKPTILERGVDNIKFHSVAGLIELVAHTAIWRGYAYGLLQDGTWKKVGSTDVTNHIPGLQQSGDAFLVMSNTAGVESRTYSDFALICDAVARSFYVSGLTQSAV